MLSFHSATIRKKLIWSSALASVCALLLAGTAFFTYHLVTFRNSLVRNLTIQADTIALNSVSALRFNDEGSAADTLAALRADPNIITAAIYSADGRLFASHVGPNGEARSVAPVLPPVSSDVIGVAGRTLRLSHPIVAEEERLGSVELAYSLDDLYADTFQGIGLGLLVLVLSVSLAFLVSSRILRSFSESIGRLAAAARGVSQEKDYAIRVEPTRNRDELGLLIDTFNEMLTQIQARDTEVEAGKLQFQTLNEELEQRVLQRTAELEATNKELEAFTYSVSHDLRAPLRRIDGFAKLLVDDYAANLPDEAARYLSRVREGAKHMGLLVDDMLNLARVARQELKMHVTGLSSIVRNVTTLLKRDAEGRDIEWRIQPLPFVECDPSLMEVVFTNLLSNAVKYTRPREHAVIEVGAIEQNGHPVIFVRDNGVGFSMKYVSKLFGVFQRLHRPEDFEGTGVGLATVQRILHKHGGAIWVEAELDKGASFYFTIGVVPHSESEKTFHAGQVTNG